MVQTVPLMFGAKLLERSGGCVERHDVVPHVGLRLGGIGDRCGNLPPTKMVFPARAIAYTAGLGTWLSLSTFGVTLLGSSLTTAGCWRRGHDPAGRLPRDKKITARKRLAQCDAFPCPASPPERTPPKPDPLVPLPVHHPRTRLPILRSTYICVMAGFLDKAKQAAQQALDEAKKGIDSGQAKLDEHQAKRETERLLAEVGAAVYAQQRQGGSPDAVTAALAAVDAHVATNGLVGFPPSAVVPGSPPPAPPADSTPPPPPPTTQPGPPST